MGRWITWIAEQEQRGWACSECDWKYMAPALLTDADAKNAYDRLAHASFEKHQCASYPKYSGPSGQEPFQDRVRKFISKGYKPKDAVELVLQEISLEYRHEPRALAKAQSDAEEFMRNLRGGKI